MKKSVLVIDDERDLCEVIARALKKEGFEVECAFNLAEAREKLLTHPAIIFLDKNLPDEPELEYLQMHPVDFMGSYVVMIKADPSSTLQKGAETKGIQSFLPKPFNVNRLKQLISDVIYN